MKRFLVDEAAAERDGDRMRPVTSLQMSEETSNLRLYRLLALHKPLSDLGVAVAIRGQPKHIELRWAGRGRIIAAAASSLTLRGFGRRSALLNQIDRIGCEPGASRPVTRQRSFAFRRHMVSRRNTGRRRIAR